MMQTINVESKVPISLDRIIDYILDNLEEQTPAFVRECDQKVSQELHAYTKDIMAQDNINVPDIVISEKVAEIVETKSGALLDSICEANSAYLEVGVHIGANLLWQLLDL